MKMYKGESMKKYEKVWRLRTPCHRRWMDLARQKKEKGGTLSQKISPEIKIYMI